ncbi:MAG: EamA family transporter [Ectothiorhodospiraceae bacterium]|nr:EamA family transporter [Ectothiorhodospiraceae bacterium]
MNSRSKAYLFAGAAVLFWSTVATAFKLSLQSATVEELLLVSSAVSLAALFVISAVQGNVKRLREWSFPDIAYSAVLGLLNPFLYYLVLFRAYDVLLAQHALALNYLWPIILALLSIPFLKQPMRLRTLLALLVSFAGVVLLVTRGDIASFETINLAGAGLALGSTVIWAAYWIANVRDTRDAVLRLALNFAFGTAYIAFYMLFTGGITLPSSEGLLGGLYIGLFEMGITFVLWRMAISTAATARVGSLVYAAPFLSLVFIALVLGESIYLSTVYGLLLIISGILLQDWKSTE